MVIPAIRGITQDMNASPTWVRTFGKVIEIDIEDNRIVLLLRDCLSQLLDRFITANYVLPPFDINEILWAFITLLLHHVDIANQVEIGGSQDVPIV